MSINLVQWLLISAPLNLLCHNSIDHIHKFIHQEQGPNSDRTTSTAPHKTTTKINPYIFKQMSTIFSNMSVI